MKQFAWIICHAVALRPLRGSRFALSQPDAFGAGAFLPAPPRPNHLWYNTRQ